jgi:hypothetical protein
MNGKVSPGPQRIRGSVAGSRASAFTIPSARSWLSTEPESPGLDDDEVPGDLFLREPAQHRQDGRVELAGGPVAREAGHNDAVMGAEGEAHDVPEAEIAAHDGEAVGDGVTKDIVVGLTAQSTIADILRGESGGVEPWREGSREVLTGKIERWYWCHANGPRTLSAGFCRPNFRSLTRAAT